MISEVIAAPYPVICATVCSFTMLTSGTVVNNCFTDIEPIPILGEASSSTDNIYRVNGSVLLSNIITITNQLKENLNKLEEIQRLPDNWNGNNASAFSDSLISRVKDILLEISIQPEVFPTAADSIQLEYEGEDGSYLEFQIADKESADVFLIDTAGEECEFSVKCSTAEIEKVVSKFYG